MVTWSLDDKQANICLMAGADDKTKEKACYESNTFSSASSDDEENMPYDVLLHNYHMISLQCKRFKEKFKAFVCQNIELMKSNEDLKKKIQTLGESLSKASKTDESSPIKRLREEVACLTKDFGKFLESSKTLTMLLKFHQHPHKKSGLGLEKGTSSSKSQSKSDKCYFCGRIGHSKFKCIHKKKKNSKGTNYDGHKKIWVPKSQIVHVADTLGRKMLGFKLVPGQWMLMTHNGGKVYVPRPKAT